MSKRVLITGAGSGFGRGIALELSGRGHSVVAGVEHAAQVPQLEVPVAEAQLEMEIVVLDITDPVDRRGVLSRDFDVLINNAGVMETGPVAEIPMERVRRNFEVNVFGTLAMCQGVAASMVRRGSGKIINISSMAGLATVPFAAVYSATKHALESLSEGLKEELSGTGVEVCIVNSGAFDTGFHQRGLARLHDWFDQETTLSTKEFLSSLAGLDDRKLNPALMVAALVEIVESTDSKFRNVVPVEMEDWIRAAQSRTWSARNETRLWIDMPQLSSD